MEYTVLVLQKHCFYTEAEADAKVCYIFGHVEHTEEYSTKFVDVLLVIKRILIKHEVLFLFM